MNSTALLRQYEEMDKRKIRVRVVDNCSINAQSTYSFQQYGQLSRFNARHTIQVGADARLPHLKHPFRGN